jgi:coenzyme A diphosphatase NUDT7
MCTSKVTPTTFVFSGLNCSRLIDLATVAYGTVPSFERFAPGQPSFRQVISQVVYELPRSLEAEAARSKTGMPTVGQPMEWALMRSGKTVRSVEQWQDKAE